MTRTFIDWLKMIRRVVGTCKGEGKSVTRGSELLARWLCHADAAASLLRSPPTQARLIKRNEATYPMALPRRCGGKSRTCRERLLFYLQRVFDPLLQNSFLASLVMMISVKLTISKDDPCLFDIHKDPVRAGFVERADDYRWSSARFWSKCPNEDEPLRVDIDKIVWRRS